MIKVKITESGGYVVGDGAIPGNLDPDSFMRLFIGRIFEAKRAGLAELDVSEDECRMAAAMYNRCEEQALEKFNEARVLEYGDDDFPDAETLLEAAI